MPYMTYTPTIHVNVPNNVSQRHYLVKFNPEGEITEDNAFTTSL